jgi:uncharacterized membrane protein YcaP (DUF421 family)
MSYVTIFHPIPWPAVGQTVIQSITVYWLILLGLKLTGRRVFGEMGPQDLIILLLISESCDLGLANQEAGYCGTIASVFSILLMGNLVERTTFLRQFFEDKAVILYENGTIHEDLMRKHMVEHSDLEKTAREYGREHYRAFRKIVLEGDGKLTAVLQEPDPASPHPEETGVAG